MVNIYSFKKESQKRETRNKVDKIKKDKPKPWVEEPYMMRPCLVDVRHHDDYASLGNPELQTKLNKNPAYVDRLLRDLWQRVFELGEMVPCDITPDSIYVHWKYLQQGEKNAVEIQIKGHYLLLGEVYDGQARGIATKQDLIHNMIDCLKSIPCFKKQPNIEKYVPSPKEVQSKQLFLLAIHRCYGKQSWQVLSISLVGLVLFFSTHVFFLLVLGLLPLIWWVMREFYLDAIQTALQRGRSLSFRVVSWLLGLYRLSEDLSYISDWIANSSDRLDVLSVQKVYQQASTSDSDFLSLSDNFKDKVGDMLALDSNSHLRTLSPSEIVLLIKASCQPSSYYQRLAYRARAGQEILACIQKSSLDQVMSLFHFHDVFICLSALKKQSYLSQTDRFNILSMKSLTMEFLDQVLLDLTIRAAAKRPDLAELFPIPRHSKSNEDTQLLRSKSIQALGPMIYDAIFWPVRARKVVVLTKDSQRKRAQMRQQVSGKAMLALMQALQELNDMTKKDVSPERLSQWLQEYAYLSMFFGDIESVKKPLVHPTDVLGLTRKLRRQLSLQLIGHRCSNAKQGYATLWFSYSMREWLELIWILPKVSKEKTFFLSDQMVSSFLAYLNQAVCYDDDPKWQSLLGLIQVRLSQREDKTKGSLLGHKKHYWSTFEYDEVIGKTIEDHNIKVKLSWFERILPSTTIPIVLSQYRSKPRRASLNNKVSK